MFAFPFTLLFTYVFTFIALLLYLCCVYDYVICCVCCVCHGDVDLSSIYCGCDHIVRISLSYCRSIINTSHIASNLIGDLIQKDFV